MPGLIGKKIGMSNIFTDDGQLVPVTIINAGPCPVLNVMTIEKNGYEALQFGFGTRKENRVSKPVLGQYKKQNLTPAQIVKEFRNFNVADYKVGDSVGVEIFTQGDSVKVTGRSKGKGFQGVMRRHGFGGVGGTTHGQSDRLRAPGSIGASSYPSRVFKGQRMAGRTGFEQVTVQNLKIVKIIPEKNIIMVKGAVPGAINSIVEINK
ncbi:MAG: 50S ribosomal protein L3 [Ignavibacteria bacterium]|jgi:large subunit ribosomal protein L3|nr:50S ribosomal protein L3 [Ignavibacteria bacterium]MCU7499139.1 50S ribosomal protein L3 [Ignavibacteria bacterium]MCU7502509.1 50S ribosomal protein L3 [Ignavibacteria bacterium]MCU7512969.1 50S ribosomal protein L3 [Ignavibacteria bacterium]MCU7514926.1 50S ribosomal protein L3 [Ignavibacteria bacterium]